MNRGERRNDSNGRLIVFEGVDGVGKSTIASATRQALLGQGVHVELLAFPGNELGTLGQLVYDIHHSPAAPGIPATSVQLLHVAAHVDAIENRILPALSAGKWVILDRFWWSTWVYGIAYGAPHAALKGMLAAELEHWGATRPDVVFLVQRARGRGRPNREERRLRTEYEQLADREVARGRVCRIRNNRSVAFAVNIALRAILGDDHQPRKRGNQNSLRDQDTGAQLQLGFTETNSAPSRVYVCASIAPAKPTIVYDTYWRFAAERQQVFFRRWRGCAPPWTNDLIIQHHKFTNAYRASDRVSQFLIRRVIYDGDQSPRELFFRTLLFKTFNRIDTWERLEHAFGRVEYSEYSYRAYDRVLRQAQQMGKRIYSAAYIMPSGNRSFGRAKKHQNHLRLIERMVEDGVPERLAEMSSMADAFQLLRSYPMIGDFLAYQYVTDLNYSRLTNFSEMDFVMPGPGARDGIRKCFLDLGGLTEPEMIRFMADRQAREFERLGMPFLSLWGRPLQLIDCQNLFCEVDKYARLAHPEVRGITGRTRIKQRFKPNLQPIDYWYPPKWGINDRIAVGCEEGT